ncbi:MAG: carbohydrate kinase family protein [Halobacteriales archaeon]
MARVVCAGHVNWDVTLRVDTLPEPDGEVRLTDQSSSGGGSAANTAVALAGLDVPCGLVGSVGDDEHGTLLRGSLNEHGVDLAGLQTVAGVETTVKYLIVDAAGEVMVLGNAGANEAVTAEDIDPALLQSVEHLHLTGQRPETAAELARRGQAVGATVSFDPGRRFADRDFDATLETADLLFLNDREADAVPESAAGGIRDSIVVRKLGRSGAEVRVDGEVISHDGFDVDPVDSTGAGDAFAAGFMAARLEGAGYRDALAYGNACGALTTAAQGGWVAPSRAEVHALLDRAGAGLDHRLDGETVE